MSTARDVMLGRIRAALRDVPRDEQPASVVVERGYLHHDPTPHAELVVQFAERVNEYKATVRRITQAELPGAIAAACVARQAAQLVIPADLPDEWLPPGLAVQRDAALSYTQLDASDGVITGCALGIAQTGTIILDGGAYQGRRALSLLPDYHLCIVFAAQIVGLVPEAITRLDPAARRRPITFISGPSATSDIELSRVEGVHGPRTLDVLVVG